MKNYKVIYSEGLSELGDPRYVIVNPDTGELLDDAQGYGYKSAQKAHAAFAYKNQTRSERKAKEVKKKTIEKWLKSHKDFEIEFEILLDDIIHGCYGPEIKITTQQIQKILTDKGYNDLSFTASELCRYLIKR